jgi:hypothetical protein
LRVRVSAVSRPKPLLAPVIRIVLANFDITLIALILVGYHFREPAKFLNS